MPDDDVNLNKYTKKAVSPTKYYGMDFLILRESMMSLGVLAC